MIQGGDPFGVSNSSYICQGIWIDVICRTAPVAKVFGVVLLRTKSPPSLGMIDRIPFQWLMQVCRLLLLFLRQANALRQDLGPMDHSSSLLQCPVSG